MIRATGSPSTAVLHVSSMASRAMFEKMNARLVRENYQAGGMSESGLRFHWAIQSGLASQPNTDLTVLVGRALHPKGHRGVFWRATTEHFRPHWRVHYVATINRGMVKQLSTAFGMLLGTLRWRWKTRHYEDRLLIIDGAFITAIPMVLLALLGSGVTKLCLVADIYHYMGDVPDLNDRPSRWVRVIRPLMQQFYRKFNGFILLTEAMNPVINPSSRPYLVMEGLISSEQAEEPIPSPRQAGPRRLLYAGALRAEYGLPELVDGFLAAENEGWVLQIFGAGEYAATIESMAARHPNIIWGGRVSPEEAHQAVIDADLLVNPRPVAQPLSELSFPSKMLEYLSSATPVVSTRLTGMPVEYYPHLIVVEKPGAAGIQEALNEAFTMTPEELARLGQSGRHFVLAQKNNTVQTRRIMAFAQSLE